MQTIEVKLYEISELPEEARTKAIDYLRERGYFDVEADEIEERFKEKLKEYGLPTDDIQFSLSWSQGDGVAFYGNIDLHQLITETGMESEYTSLINYYELSATITRNSFGTHYSHWNTMDVYMERGREYVTTLSQEQGKELWDHIKDTVVKVSKELEREGYEMIEANQKEEYVVECAEANEMLFREDGRLWS